MDCDAIDTSTRQRRMTSAVLCHRSGSSDWSWRRPLGSLLLCLLLLMMWTANVGAEKQQHDPSTSSSTSSPRQKSPGRQLGTIDEQIDPHVLAEDPLADPHFELRYGQATDQGMAAGGTTTIQRYLAQQLIRDGKVDAEILKIGAIASGGSEQHEYFCMLPKDRLAWEASAYNASAAPTPILSHELSNHPEKKKNTATTPEAVHTSQPLASIKDAAMAALHILDEPVIIKKNPHEATGTVAGQQQQHQNEAGQEDTLCVGITLDYWTYQFCPNHRLVQMHLERTVVPGSPPVATVSATTSYVLGKFPKRKTLQSDVTIKRAFDHHAMFHKMHLATSSPSTSSSTSDDHDDGHKAAKKKSMTDHHTGDGDWSITETWRDGTLCDLTKVPRETKVEYRCVAMDKEPIEIVQVREVSTCVYHVVIHYRGLCALPAFAARPPSRRSTIGVQPINCLRVLADKDAANEDAGDDDREGQKTKLAADATISTDDAIPRQNEAMRDLLLGAEDEDPFAPMSTRADDAEKELPKAEKKKSKKKSKEGKAKQSVKTPTGSDSAKEATKAEEGEEAEEEEGEEEEEEENVMVGALSGQAMTNVLQQLFKQMMPEKAGGKASSSSSASAAEEDILEEADVASTTGSKPKKNAKHAQKEEETTNDDDDDDDEDDANSPPLRATIIQTTVEGQEAAMLKSILKLMGHDASQEDAEGDENDVETEGEGEEELLGLASEKKTTHRAATPQHKDQSPDVDAIFDDQKHKNNDDNNDENEKDVGDDDDQPLIALLTKQASTKQKGQHASGSSRQNAKAKAKAHDKDGEEEGEEGGEAKLLQAILTQVTERWRSALTHFGSSDGQKDAANEKAKAKATKKKEEPLSKAKKERAEAGRS